MCSGQLRSVLKTMESDWFSTNTTSGKENGVGLDQEKYLVGLYGWRRRCLLLVISLLLVLVLLNLTLSLWMLKIMHFSTTGMGALNVVERGLQLEGEAIMLDKLIASRISSRQETEIQVESSKNISLISRNTEGHIKSKMFLGNDRLDVMASSVKIADSRDRLVFSVEQNEALVGAEVLRISGDGGVVLHGSVQSPLVRPEAGKNLKLESPTRSLNVFALHGVNVEARAGNIDAKCRMDIKLYSKISSMKLDSPNIYMSKVPTVTETWVSSHETMTFAERPPSSSQTSSSLKGGVYQVCVCGKGRVFLAPPEGPCVADNDVCR